MCEVTYSYNGNNSTEQVLKGETPTSVPTAETVNAVAPDKKCFDYWYTTDETKSVDPAKTAILTATTFNVKFADDENENKVPDYKEILTVTYSYNGETDTEQVFYGNKPASVTANETVNGKAPSGKCFDYWYTTDVTKEVTPGNTVITENITFNAKFANDKNNNDVPDYKEMCEVTYSYNGNTPTEQVLKGEKPTSVPTTETVNAVAPDKKCFDYWYTTDETKSVDPAKTAILTATTFNVKFADDKNNNDVPDYKEMCEVTYSYNGNTPTEQVLKGETPTSVPTAETINAVAPDKKCFDYWYTTDDTKSVDPAKTAILTATTFNVKFADDENENKVPDYKEILTVTYSYNGETDTEQVFYGNKPASVTANETVNGKAPSGKCFDYWYTTDVTKEVTPGNTVITENITFNAKFANDKNNNDVPDYKEMCEVTYSYNGNNSTEQVLKGEKPTSVPTAETVNAVAPDKKRFDYWYTTDETKSVDPVNTEITAATTFYAKFVDDKNNNDVPDYMEMCEVTYSYNGNNPTEQVLKGEKPTSVPTAETINAAAPDKKCFDYWYTTDETKSVDPAKTAILTATTFNVKFADDENENKVPDYKEILTVTYSYNGNNPTEQVLKGEKPTSIPTAETVNAVAPDKKCFDYWYTTDETKSVDPSNTEITAETTFNVKFADDENKNNIPDYKESTYTVTYKNYADKSMVLGSEEILYNTKPTGLTGYNSSIISYCDINGNPIDISELNITAGTDVYVKLTYWAKINEEVIIGNGLKYQVNGSLVERVGNIAESALAEKEANHKNENLKLVLNVTETEDTNTAEQQAIKAIQQGKTIDFFDMTLMKYVNSDPAIYMTNSKKVLEIVISYDMTNKNNFSVCRYHEEASELVNSKSLEDGTYFIEGAGKNAKIHICVDKFSLYGFCYGANPANPEIEIETNEISIKKGETKKINVTVINDNTGNVKPKFECLDKDTVKVDSNGNVTGLKAGTARVRVYLDNGSSMIVTVYVSDNTPTLTGEVAHVVFAKYKEVGYYDFSIDGGNTWYHIYPHCTVDIPEGATVILKTTDKENNYCFYIDEQYFEAEDNTVTFTAHSHMLVRASVVKVTSVASLMDKIVAFFKAVRDLFSRWFK